MRSLSYVSARGEELPLDGPASYVGVAAGLRGRAWSYELGWRSVSSISRDARECEVDAALTDLAEADRLRRAADRDLAESTPGRLVYAGEWETRAYLVKAETSSRFHGSATQKLTFAMLDGTWRRWRSHDYYRDGGAPGDWLDMRYDLPYDLSRPAQSGTVEGSAWSSSPVRLTVFGPASDPAVQIAGNVYECDVEVPDGTRLVVDGLAKTIELVGADGTRTNAFASGVRGTGEGSGTYVFERVPPGESPIAWDMSFTFTVEVCDEESEPPWT